MRRTRKLTRLVDEVEELLAQLGNDQSPEIADLRTQVAAALAATKQALAQRRIGSGRIRQYAGSLDDYINGYPRLAFGTGILFAGTLGYLIGATGRAYRAARAPR